MWTFTELLRHIYGNMADDDVDDDGHTTYSGWVAPPKGFLEHHRRVDVLQLQHLFTRLYLALTAWNPVDDRDGEFVGWFEYKIVVCKQSN
jgi:hypothetical protein